MVALSRVDIYILSIYYDFLLQNRACQRISQVYAFAEPALTRLPRATLT